MSDHIERRELKPLEFNLYAVKYMYGELVTVARCKTSIMSAEEFKIYLKKNNIAFDGIQKVNISR